jgi:hypothetical protein
MMRSRNRHSNRSLSELIRDNPFLCIAFLALLCLAAIEAEVGSAAMLELFWALLGAGFLLVVDWPASLMPGIPPALNLILVAAFGLIPYLLCDVVWRMIRHR